MAAGLTLAADFAQAAGSYEAGQTRARLLRANADIARAQAQSEYQAGAYNESMVRLRGAATTGQQIAQIGANNLQQAGTPSQVVASTAMINEMDALQTRNNAARRAWGFQVQGTSDQFQESQAQRGGAFTAAGSILSGGAKALNQFNSSGSWF